MNEINKDKTITSLFEILSVCQKIILNSLDIKNLKLTKTQLFILMALMRNKSLNMSQLSIYIASSQEQATRAVAPLVTSGLLERFYDESNRKLVLVRLTETGKELIRSKKQFISKHLLDAFDVLTEQEAQELLDALDQTLKILSTVERNFK